MRKPGLAPASELDAGALSALAALAVGGASPALPVAWVALVALLAPPARVAAQQPPSALAAAAGAWASAPGAPVALDVPFVPQGELLCGGAAAAMVLRYHGERGARAESFAPLVRGNAGGIRTDELAAELVRRGWAVRTPEGNLAALAAALVAGTPPIVLIASSAGRWHYVVVVAAGDGEVRVHDPARAPDVRMSEADFLERWDGGGRWALLVLPMATRSAPPAELADRAAPASPALLAASARFRARDWSGAADAAAAAAAAEPADLRAWRLLASSLYLAGRPDDALDAWARASEPRLDGVRVSGLSRTRHPVVHALIGLTTGARLDRADLDRARLRVALLPGTALTHVGYRALPDGWAETEAVVVEGPPHPLTRTGLATAALAAASGEVVAWESGRAGAGERLDARWRPGQDGGLAVQLAAPGVPRWAGRTEVGAVWRSGGRDAAWLRATDWSSPWLRWEAGARVDRVGSGGFRPGITAALQLARPRAGLGLRLGGSVWPGSSSNALVALDAGAARGGAAQPWSAVARAGARAAVGEGFAPLLPAVGARGERALAGPFMGPDPLPLLRAHAAESGTRVIHGGVEGTRWRGGALRLGLAAFVDFAAVRKAAGWGRFADAGVGARVTLPGLVGALRVDHAWSLTDRRHRWSLGWALTPEGAFGP